MQLVLEKNYSPPSSPPFRPYTTLDSGRSHSVAPHSATRRHARCCPEVAGRPLHPPRTGLPLPCLLASRRYSPLCSAQLGSSRRCAPSNASALRPPHARAVCEAPPRQPLARCPPSRSMKLHEPSAAWVTCRPREPPSMGLQPSALWLPPAALPSRLHELPILKELTHCARDPCGEET